MTGWQYFYYMIKLRRRLSVWKWILIVLLAIAIPAGGIVWYLGNKWRPVLDRQLQELVADATDSLYHLEYSGLWLNPVTGNATVKNLKLIPDTSVYRKLERLKMAPDNMYVLKVKKIQVHDFHPKLLFQEKKIHVGRITLEGPGLTITNRRHLYNNLKTDTPDNRTLYQRISGIFKAIRVDSILFRDVDFAFVNKNQGEERVTTVRKMDLTIHELLIDSLSEYDPRRFYHMKNINVRLRDYRIATPDSLYSLQFRDLVFSSFSRQLTVNGLMLSPQYDAGAFYKKVKQSKDRFDLTFGRVVISNIDLNKFSAYQRFYAGKLSIADVKAEINNTNALPKEKEDKTGTFPHQLLQKLAWDLRIDTVQVRNADIVYSEFNKVTGSSGHVKFTGTNGWFYNVTNDPSAIRKNRVMRAALSTRFMDAAPLRVSFKFNLTGSGAFSYSGDLGEMDGRALNTLIRPLAMVEIRSAKVRKLQFHITADQQNARGKMYFWYSGLKIRLLKKDEESGKIKKQGLMSGVANYFLLNDSNPWKRGQQEVFTVGNIRYQRAATDPFFKFIWKGLFEGIKESIGVDRETEENIRTIAEKVGSSMMGDLKSDTDGLKQKRQEKKKERQKRRDGRNSDREESIEKSRQKMEAGSAGTDKKFIQKPV